MKTIFLLVFVFAASPAFGWPAHDFHTTFMTIEHNPETRNLEISLKMFRHDLVPVLEKRMKSHVDLGYTKDLDENLFQYIGERFAVTTKDGEVLETKWVGKEVDAQDVYCYLETPFDGGLEEATVSNTLFFERFSQQVNYVTLKHEGKKANMVFRAGDKAKAVLFGE